MKIDYYKPEFTELEEQQIKEEIAMLRQKYTDHIPVLIRNTQQDIILEKVKYLMPSNFTIGQAMSIIRKKMRLNPSDGLFCLINNTMMPTSNLLGAVYREHRDPNIDMLIIQIAKESVFG